MKKLNLLITHKIIYQFFIIVTIRKCINNFWAINTVLKFSKVFYEFTAYKIANVDINVGNFNTMYRIHYSYDV